MPFNPEWNYVKQIREKPIEVLMTLNHASKRNFKFLFSSDFFPFPTILIIWTIIWRSKFASNNRETNLIDATILQKIIVLLTLLVSTNSFRLIPFPWYDLLSCLSWILNLLTSKVYDIFSLNSVGANVSDSQWNIGKDEFEFQFGSENSLRRKLLWKGINPSPTFSFGLNCGSWSWGNHC